MDGQQGLDRMRVEAASRTIPSAVVGAREQLRSLEMRAWGHRQAGQGGLLFPPGAVRWLSGASYQSGARRPLTTATAAAQGVLFHSVFSYAGGNFAHLSTGSVLPPALPMPSSPSAGRPPPARRRHRRRPLRRPWVVAFAMAPVRARHACMAGRAQLSAAAR